MNVYINIEDGKYDDIFALCEKPERPQIGPLPTSAYAREYADKLDAYQIDIKAWETIRETYRAEIEQAHALFKADVLTYVFGDDLGMWASLIDTIYERNYPGLIEDRSDLSIVPGRMEGYRCYVKAAQADLDRMLQMAPRFEIVESGAS